MPHLHRIWQISRVFSKFTLLTQYKQGFGCELLQKRLIAPCGSNNVPLVEILRLGMDVDEEKNRLIITNAIVIDRKSYRPNRLKYRPQFCLVFQIVLRFIEESHYLLRQFNRTNHDGSEKELVYNEHHYENCSEECKKSEFQMLFVC